MRALLACLFASLFFAAAAGSAFARDDGQWRGADPRIRAWFQSLREPDNPAIPCCGNADAYYADEYQTKDGKLYAKITNNRGHSVPTGTIVEIPRSKIVKDANLSGHIILFLGGDPKTPVVYCYVPGTGA